MRRLLSTVIFCVMGLAVMAQSEVEPIVLDEITNVSMESASATARVSINPAGIENYNNGEVYFWIRWATSSEDVSSGENCYYSGDEWVEGLQEVYSREFEIYDLFPGSTYYVIAEMYCDNNHYLSNILSFTVPCGSSYETWENVCSQYKVDNTYEVMQEGFENGFPQGWISSDQDGDGNSWQVIPYQPYEGRYCVYSPAYSESQGSVEQKNWLVLQPIEVPEDGAILSWSAWDYEGGGASYGVYVSTSLSETFYSIYSETPFSWWNYRSVDLDDYAGQTIYIAFIHYNAGYYLFLDNIMVEGKQTLYNFTETGDHQYLIPNSYDCQDTVTLHLTVYNNRPMVVTYEVDNVAANTADGWGAVVNDCADTILESGLCYSTHPEPTISDSRVVNNTADVSYFQLTMTGLTEGTTYYMRAYATNNAGTSYGEERSFTTYLSASARGTVTDATTSRPIAGAHVSVFHTGDNNRRFVTTVTTDADGRYMVPNLMNSEFSFVANASSYEIAVEERTLEQNAINIVNMSLTPEECHAPVNVDYELVTEGGQNSLQLTWDMPGDTMTQNNSMEYAGAYGSRIDMSVGVYHLFTPESLAQYSGDMITSVGAWITGRYEYATYTLRIWTGGTENGGPTSLTPAYEQVVSHDGINMNAWNDIPLNTPFSFDRTQCLWVGFHVECHPPEGNTNGIYVIGVSDVYNISNHYGNVLQWYDTTMTAWKWNTHSENMYYLNDLYYNWMIRATIAPNSLTYNVMADGEAIASNVEGTSYTVSPYNPQQEQTCYQVSANCPNGHTSEPSECATVLQTLPTVATHEITNIWSKSVTARGEVVSNGNSEIIEYGFCYSTMPHPTLTTGAYQYSSTSIEGEFTWDIWYELYPETTYYIRTYATNSLGTAYGNELTFTTLRECYTPYSLSVSDVVSSSAFVSWAHEFQDEFLYYELSYKAGEDGDWTVISNLTDEYYILTGLTPQTSYTVRVRALCDEDNASDYSSEVTFKTGCVSGEEDVLIGEDQYDSYGNYIPVMGWGYYSYSQQIYDASELQGARTIDRIEVQYYESPHTWNVDIYLGHTSNSVFSSYNDLVPYSDLTLVYSGDITFDNSGENNWFSIPLTNTFNYNGTDNLVLVFDNNSSVGESAGFYTHYVSDTKTLLMYNNNQDINPSEISGYTYMMKYRNNLRIPGICYEGGCERANVVVREVTDASATLMIVPVDNKPYELQYAVDGSDDYTTVTNVSGTTYVLEGLRQNTTYVVRIRSICGAGDTSAWKTSSFTTGVRQLERLYVSTSGTGDASSWENASSDLAWTLNTAQRILETYRKTPEIWVAEGTYYGDGSNYTAFEIFYALKLYGGFAGNETALSQRDMTAHPTILDGQNRQRVLTQQTYNDDMLIIDGFTIQNGYADSYNHGGGAYLLNNFKVSNCRFLNNYSNYYGGAVYVDGQYNDNNDKVGFYDCEFIGNRARQNGGAVYDYNNRYANYISCKFIGNSSDNSSGGAVYGGHNFVNCLIANNYAYYAPAGISNAGNQLLNCDIVGNNAAYYDGPGLKDFYGTMVNCVIWGNTSQNTANAPNVANYGFRDVQNSAVEGGLEGYDGVMNLASDNFGRDNSLNYPLFASPESGDYRLRGSSALIDAGLNGVSGLPATDLSGLERVYGSTVDIGCYENHDEAYCSAPLHLTAQGVTGNSAVIVWDNGDIDDPAYYELSYKLAEANDWTVLDEQITNTYCMLSSLQPQSAYQVRVRAFCTAERSSDYSSVFVLNTGCLDYGDEVIIGKNSNNTSSYLPFCYYNSYSQQIYDAAEVGSARPIDTLYLQSYYSITGLTRNMDIYLGHTDKYSFESSSDWIPNESLTLVYSGNLTFNSSDSWIAIPLTTAFAYNGRDNMVMAFHDKSGTYYYPQFYINYTNDHKSLYISNYNSIYTSNLGTGNWVQYRNNLKLSRLCKDGCARASLAVMDVTDASATLVFAAGADVTGFELEYMKEGDDHFISLPTEGNSLQLNELSHNTSYVVRARSLCASDSSSWATVTFRTLVKDIDHLYVTTTGTGDGSSWEQATNDLNWAVNTAARVRQEYGKEAVVWVAQGTYFGDGQSGNDAFTMGEGASVYGGFVGDEPADYDLSQRDFTAHATVLDGQNIQRVLYQPAEFSVRTTWDGFTIQNGYINGSGAGAYLRSGITLNHCEITQNTSSSSGAGVYCDKDNNLNLIYLLNCSVTGNTSSGYGGGAYLRYAVADSCWFANNKGNTGGGAFIFYSQIKNCTITQNTSTWSGGGMYMDDYSKLDHCIITRNTGANSGGGVFMYSNYNSSDSYGIFNCLIAHNNSTSSAGGGIYVSRYSRIDNTTIVNNQASNNPGGVYFNYTGVSNILNNCVIWGNTLSGNMSNITGTASMQNCAVEAYDEAINANESDNPGVIGLSSDNYGTEEGVNYPFFVTPDNDDYRLRAGSALIDAGGMSGTVPDYDLSGLARVYDDVMDIGCYEFHGEEYCVAPFGLTVEEVTGSSAMLSWRNSNMTAPDHYELSYKAEADDEWTVVDNLQSENYMLGGLETQTTYMVRMRTFCDRETGSDYSPIVMFSTNCPGDYAPEVIIGTGTYGDYYSPIYLYFPYSYTQQIYLSEEIGEARTIDTLFFQYYNYDPITRNLSIYLGHTDKEVFASASRSNLVTSGLEKVYSGAFTFSDDGENYWIGIPLQTPFEYNGSDNLVVAIKDSADSRVSTYCFYSSYTSGRYGSVCFGGNSEVDIDHLNNYYSASRRQYRANIRFQSICSDGCDRANMAVREVTDSSALIYFVAGNDTEGYELEYRKTGSEEFIPLTPGESPYLLSGLTQSTSYDVRIRSLCSGNESSRWMSRTFRTLPKKLDHLYVTTTGTGDASSWDKASSDLAWTMNTAVHIKEEYGIEPVVWVAKGTYYGDGVSNNAFTMVEGVDVYGGFAGNEPENYDLTQRDFVNNASILDGQNNQRVLYQNEGFGIRTTWDGFTLQNGKAGDNYNTYEYGGGANLHDNATLRNCRVVNNSAAYGGGIYAYANENNKYVVIDHCTIAHNFSLYDGGGIYGDRNTLIRYCDISYNKSENSSGGGLYMGYSYINSGEPVVSNTLISNNKGYHAGGVYLNIYNTVNLNNLTIVNNMATGTDAGVYSNNNGPHFNNCIVWGNRTNDGVDNVRGYFQFQNSAVEGMAMEGTGNIALMSTNEDILPYCPRFVHPSESTGSDDATENVDWHLQQGSILVNRGDNSLVYVADSLDLAGTARIKMDTVDLGCYESEYSSITMPEYGDIVYVKENGSGAMDGTSWDNAMPSLVDALMVAAMYDADVWVAAGTYYGDSISLSAFNMVQGVNVYGGFAGNEAEDYDLSLRDIDANASILDGQNNQRVLYQSTHYTVPTIWDGFTIRNGKARYDSQTGSSYGGGAYLRAGSTLKNSLITNNTSNSNGGGLYVNGYEYESDSYDTVRVINCTLTNNICSGHGAGAYLANKVAMYGCVVESNENSGYYSHGGGLYAYNAVVVRNCKIRNNYSNYYGGGVYCSNNVLLDQCDISYNAINYNGGGGVYAEYLVTLNNCLIANNKTEYANGGGLYASSANITITNSTIVNNEVFYSSYRGAGIYVNNYNEGSVTISNSVVWGNKRDGTTDGIYGAYDNNYTAYYVASDVPFVGEHKVMLSEENDAESVYAPRFVHPSAEVGVSDTTRNVDWHMMAGSPCINRGDNSVASQYDLDGADRVQQDTVDLGCYESPYNGITLPEYGDIIYVVEGGAGTRTGESWENATGSLQEALDIAAFNNADVWVAAGTYHGDGTSENAFVMKPGVDVYGGFAGIEAPDYDLSQRDFSANTSVLDGQYAQRVLMQDLEFSASTAVVWDGFTIQNGRVKGDGAGVYMRAYSTLRNCIVRNNLIASEDYSYNSYYGAGVHAAGNSSTYNTFISYCTIAYNGYENIGYMYGGGAYVYYAKVDHTEISHNRATHGGGVDGDYSAYFDNCLIFGNMAAQYGGGVCVEGYESKFVNCDIVKNSASSNYGGIYNRYSTPTITNSIIWGNKVNLAVNNVPDYSGYTYCAIEPNSENSTVSSDGNLALASGNDGFDNTKNYVRFTDPENEDFRLHPSSSCINVGDNSVVTDTLDFYRSQRIISDVVDMGCSEVQDESNCLSVINLNVNNITTNSALLSWHARGEESQWVVIYGEVGSSEANSVTVSDTTYQITGLSLNRHYAAKVRTICEENVMSIFSIPVYFQTTCDPEQLDTLPNFGNMFPANNEIVYSNHASFSWPAMDHATSYDFYLWKSTGAEPTTPSLSGLTQPVVNSYEIPGYAPGAVFYWKVVAWNECISKSSEVMTLNANKLPDLHVTGINCSNPRIGQTLTVEWTVKNDGEGNTPPGLGWYDYIWLVHDADVRFYDPHDRNLLRVDNLQALNAGETYTTSAEVTIPTDIDPGNYYLFVFADQPDAYSPDFSQCPGGVAPVPYTPSVTGDPYPYVKGNVHFEGSVDETENHDNFFYVLLTVLPPPSPDLVVSAVTHTDVALSGYEANVTWTVVNNGEAAAMGSWTDAVYLSSDTALDINDDLRIGRFIHQGPLAIGENYQQSEQFIVPVDFEGDYYFIIMTDNSNNVYEGLEEMNNKTVSTAMRVTMSWFTDLQISDITIPDQVDANGIYNCTFTVTNNGASPTNVSRWTDAIYLSQDAELNQDSARRVFSSVRQTALAALDVDNPENSSYQVEAQVRIPADITGGWYLHIMTDVENQVFEYNAEGNNIVTHQPALTVLNPDLTVSGIVLPDEVDPNEPVRVQWSVRNNGPGNVVTRSFKDRFYLDGNLIYTANVRDINIPSGDSIVRFATIQLPCLGVSTADLLIITDVDDEVLEAVETNNSKTVNLELSTPDLVVSEVTPVFNDNETSLWSGTAAELSYTVVNNGVVAAVNDHSADKVYFSASPDSYQASDLIYTNTHALNLEAGESETFSCTVTLPNGISGNYYYHVVCNVDTGVCEGAHMDNNGGASEAVEVQLSPSPDLTFTQVVAPNEAYLGAAFNITYTIKNQGAAAINNTVMQKFYYSMSPTAYDTTKLLATVYDYLNLEVNGEVTNVANVTLPANMLYGNYYIHAVTDANDQIYEHNGEDNNKMVSNRIVASAYQLDLQMTQVDGPEEMQWGQTATYTLHIRNNSALPTIAASWQDVIFLSSDDVLHSTDQQMQAVRHTEVVAPGEEYEVEIQVTIPYGTPATVYLLGVTDLESANPDINVGNNLLAKQLTVNSVPTPDLAVSDVVILDEVYAGQPARLAYKVTNVGETPIEGATWNDKLFVSYNDTYENIDLQLLNRDRRNMTLDQEESYTDTLTFTVPMSYSGNLYLLMMVNASNNPYETVRTNNTVAVPVNVVLPLPGDLVVTSVTCESSVVSGQMLHADWTIQNIGDNALSGRGLRSLVYISVDTMFDANDRLLGSVTTPYVSLGIDETMQQSLTGRVSGLAPGKYYLIVKTDVTNAFNEVSDDNNTGCSVDPFTVTIRPLPFNQDVHDTIINDVVSDYMLTVGSQVNQTVRIHVNSEDVNLGAVNMIYATYNNMGNNLNYSYSTIGQYTANSELYIPATQPGYYGVNIYGSTPTNQPQNVIVRADILPFELISVNDNHGGNTGVVTVELIGSRFRPDMEVCMRRGTEVICADTLIYVNYYQAFAQFDLTGHTPGVYDLSAVNFCEGESILANAFTIENGQPSGLAYNLLFPSSPRPNRSVVMMLEFGNIGNVDLHDQVLEITSVGGSPIAMTSEGLAQHRTTLRIPLSIDGEPNGLLRPGSYGTINVYCYSSGALIFTIKPVEE